MNQLYYHFDYNFFLIFEYIRCVFKPNEGKANHHCVIGLLCSYAIIYFITSLPVFNSYINEIISSLHGDFYAITCFLYSYYTTLVFLSFSGAIHFVTIYSKPFLNFVLSDAFIRNKAHIVLKISKNYGVDLIDIKVDHLNAMDSSELNSSFEIIFHNEKMMVCRKPTKLNKLFIRNKFLIEYGKDNKFAYEKIKAYLGMDAFDYEDSDLNEFFKVAMLNNGKPINFYTLYNQWLCLAHDFPNKLFLNIPNNEMLDCNTQMYAQTFDPDFPEDFITLNLILSGDIAKVKGHAGSGGYSTHASFEQYINRRLKHPFNSEKYLSYNDLEPYSLNDLVQFIPALIFGFKMTHIEQLIQSDINGQYVLQIIDTMSKEDKQNKIFIETLESFDQELSSTTLSLG